MLANTQTSQRTSGEGQPVKTAASGLSLLLLLTVPTFSYLTWKFGPMVPYTTLHFYSRFFLSQVSETVLIDLPCNHWSVYSLGQLTVSGLYLKHGVRGVWRQPPSCYMGMCVFIFF